jgi:hypothetical protein
MAFLGLLLGGWKAADAERISLNAAYEHAVNFG